MGVAAATVGGLGASASDAAILVVDDTYSKRLAIESLLEPLGHPVVIAESGQAALEEVQRRSFAVILMDVRMPTMTGYEAAARIRRGSDAEHTPIIFVTSCAEDEVQIPTAYESGAVDFIFTPLSPGILRAKVSVFVELFLKTRELERSLAAVTALSDQFFESEARAQSVLSNVADGIVTVSESGTIESVNPAAIELFGYNERDLIGRQFATVLAGGAAGNLVQRATVEREIWFQQQRRQGPGEVMGCRKDGSTFAMELELSEVLLETRTIYIGCLRDISARQAYTEILQYQALHDDLTGLANRALFADRVSHAIGAAERMTAPLALLVMDLNEFKEVNDTLGHQHGDELLKLVAQRLVNCLRKGDTVARLGGDEFGILPFGATDLGGAAAVAWKIQQALEAPFAVEANTIMVSASIGVALFPQHGANIDDLLRRADLAMYDAKGSGSGYAIFAAAQEEAPARRLALLSSLRHCVERDELVLHYQPKVDLGTQRTVGVEALVRWNHPSGRLAMPDEFIPEIERSELMLPITEWVINEALRSLSIWRDQGYDLTMAVNIGARCLAQDSEFFEAVERLTTRWDVPPEKLTFELTESALIDTAAPDMLAALHAMAEQLSIDDFGTGYSSLGYLQRLPIAEIKVDKSFVIPLLSSAADAVIVRAIINLAHNLGAKVVAEGVEDAVTMQSLIEYGCDEAQGYFFSRPVPAVDLTHWLRDSQRGIRSPPSHVLG
jgi:diguanylate cyclase (GGDEF)-like protein/PAS domain S-box-containing protein